MCNCIFLIFFINFFFLRGLRCRAWWLCSCCPYSSCDRLLIVGLTFFLLCWGFLWFIGNFFHLLRRWGGGAFMWLAKVCFDYLCWCILLFITCVQSLFKIFECCSKSSHFIQQHQLKFVTCHILFLGSWGPRMHAIL